MVDGLSDASFRTWIFQASPERYRIIRSLSSQSEEYWNLNQHARRVRAGDRVFIWVSGSDAGIYADGRVLTNPVTMSDSAVGVAHWINPIDGVRPKPRVLVRYDRVFVERPLGKSLLEWDPILRHLRIMRFPRGTNFPVTEVERVALERWLDGE